MFSVRSDKACIVQFVKDSRRYAFIADNIIVTYWQNVDNPMEGQHRRKQSLELEPMDGGSHFKCLHCWIGNKEYPVGGSDMYRIEQLQDILSRLIVCTARVDGQITFNVEVR